MKDDFELIRGSGNVFSDFGRGNASVEQARAILAAKIISTLTKKRGFQGVIPENPYKLW
jgi:hypothetical protein